MNRLANALTRNSFITRKITQSRYLHYKPGPGRSREAIREPQELDHFYKYRYVPDFYPEVFGEAIYIKQDPYNIAPLYDWDNYLQEEYNEQFSYAPVWTYLIFGFGYIWLFVFATMEYIDAKAMGRTTYDNPDVSGGFGYYEH